MTSPDPLTPATNPVKMAPMENVLYWVERASRGHAATDDDGRCYGCGRVASLVADGAANDCPVCLAWLDWYATEGLSE